MNDFESRELRDVKLSHFNHVVGQANAKQALQVAVNYSIRTGKRLADLLLVGPSGTGKTSLVQIVADTLAVPFRSVMSQAVNTQAELNSLLLGSEGVVFLDELHMLSVQNMHSILSVIDDRRISVGGGKSVTSIPLHDNLVLVGATTDPDAVIGPLAQRLFTLHLDLYNESELGEIVRQRCRALSWQHEAELLPAIAQRARQTPRIALRLLQSAHRVSVAEGADSITVRHLERACEIERISPRGLDNVQQQYVQLLGKGPLRLNELASLLAVASTKVLTKTVEPYLLRAGMIVKDGGVRSLTQTGREHLTELSGMPA